MEKDENINNKNYQGYNDNQRKNNVDNEDEQLFVLMKEADKNRNRYLFVSTLIVVIIVFLVIYLSFKGDYLKSVTHENLVKAPPTNRIIGARITDEDEINDDDKENIPKEKGKTDIIFDNYIYLINQFPITDEVGKGLEGEFKMQDIKVEHSSSDIGRKIDVTLEKMPETDLEEDWVKVYLTRNGDDIQNCYRSTNRIKTFNEYTRTSALEDKVILYSGTITSQDFANQFTNYRLRMWISEDVNLVNQNYDPKTFVARLIVSVHD